MVTIIYVHLPSYNSNMLIILIPLNAIYEQWLLPLHAIMPYPIGSMYGIYANIWGILMGSMSPYIAYM